MSCVKVFYASFIKYYYLNIIKNNNFVISATRQAKNPFFLTFFLIHFDILKLLVILTLHKIFMKKTNSAITLLCVLATPIHSMNIPWSIEFCNHAQETNKRRIEWNKLKPKEKKEQWQQELQEHNYLEKHHKNPINTMKNKGKHPSLIIDEKEVPSHLAKKILNLEYFKNYFDSNPLEDDTFILDTQEKNHPLGPLIRFIDGVATNKRRLSAKGKKDVKENDLVKNLAKTYLEHLKDKSHASTYLLVDVLPSAYFYHFPLYKTIVKVCVECHIPNGWYKNTFFLDNVFQNNLIANGLNSSNSLHKKIKNELGIPHSYRSIFNPSLNDINLVKDWVEGSKAISTQPGIEHYDWMNLEYSYHEKWTKEAENIDTKKERDIISRIHERISSAEDILNQPRGSQDIYYDIKRISLTKKECDFFTGKIKELYKEKQKKDGSSEHNSEPKKNQLINLCSTIKKQKKSSYWYANIFLLMCEDPNFMCENSNFNTSKDITIALCLKDRTYFYHAYMSTKRPEHINKLIQDHNGKCKDNVSPIMDDIIRKNFENITQKMQTIDGANSLGKEKYNEITNSKLNNRKPLSFLKNIIDKERKKHRKNIDKEHSNFWQNFRNITLFGFGAVALSPWQTLLPVYKYLLTKLALGTLFTLSTYNITQAITNAWNWKLYTNEAYKFERQVEETFKNIESAHLISQDRLA
jgi:hypothetical protein